MTLANAELGREYTVTGFDTDDEELESFLFTLGCYAGESIVAISIISGNYVVSIRDGRYNIDRELANAILVE